MERLFGRLSAGANRFSGAPGGFAVALLVVALWALTGPIFHFSDTWQLVINTGTTIVTFLLAFLINGSQNVAQARMEELERKIDEHLRENTRLTREIHKHTHCTGHTHVGAVPEVKRHAVRGRDGRWAKVTAEAEETAA